MRLGLMDYWQATPGPDRVCLAHELGMRGVEALAPSADPRLDEPGITQRSAWAKRMGVPTLALYAPGINIRFLWLGDAHLRATTFAQVAWLAQWANRHQVPLLTTPLVGYPVPASDQCGQAFEQLLNLVDTFRIRLAFKILGSADDWNPLLDPFAVKKLGVCLDPAWMDRLGLDTESELRAWSNRLVHVHLPDETILGGEHAPTRPLAGVSSLHRVLDQLGYPGAVVMHSPGLIEEINVSKHEYPGRRAA